MLLLERMSLSGVDRDSPEIGFQTACHRPFGVERDLVGNLPPMPGIFPGYPAPIVRLAESEGGRELAIARGGMPSSSKAIVEAANKCVDRLRASDLVALFDSVNKLYQNPLKLSSAQKLAVD